MEYALKDIAQTLKFARLDAGFSQRELSKRAGVPQSHISKIENGAVDLRVSSLIDLARTLGLEVILVQKKNASAVNAIAQLEIGYSRSGQGRVTRELQALRDSIADSIREMPEVPELAQFKTYTNALNGSSSPDEKNAIRQALNSVRLFKAGEMSIEKFRLELEDIRRIRNTLMHQAPYDDQRPAYALGDDDG